MSCEEDSQKFFLLLFYFIAHKELLNISETELLAQKTLGQISLKTLNYCGSMVNGIGWCLELIFYATP